MSGKVIIRRRRCRVHIRRVRIRRILVCRIIIRRTRILGGSIVRMRMRTRVRGIGFRIRGIRIRSLRMLWCITEFWRLHMLVSYPILFLSYRSKVSIGVGCGSSRRGGSQAYDWSNKPDDYDMSPLY
jgi:hypothetical protein